MLFFFRLGSLPLLIFVERKNGDKTLLQKHFIIEPVYQHNRDLNLANGDLDLAIQLPIKSTCFV